MAYDSDCAGILEPLGKKQTIERAIDFKSTVLDIGVYRIKCEVEFNGSALLDAEHQMRELKNDFDKIKNDYEEFKKFYVDYSDRVPRLMGKRIDEIESKIRAQFPKVHHIDIEIN